MRHRSRHKRLYHYYGLLCHSKRITNVCDVKKQQPEDNSKGSCLNLNKESSLPLENRPKQNLESTVLIKTCSKRKLKDTVPEESCTKQKSQSSVQSDPKVDHACLKCQRIFQTTQHKDCQNKECSSLGCNYCIACVCGTLIPDQPVVSMDMTKVGKTDNNKSHAPSQGIEETTAAGVLNDSDIFKSTDVVTSNNCVTSEATKVAGTLSNYATPENGRVAKKNDKISVRVIAMKVYMCSFCNDIFKSYCDAKFHRIAEHKTSKFVQCAKCCVYICGEIKMVATHELMELHCFHCGEDFTSSRDVISHWTKKKVVVSGLKKAKMNSNSILLETESVNVFMYEEASNHRLFCKMCNKTYETECHPNYHNFKDVFMFYRCINCSKVLRSQYQIDRHENDQLHCVYCNAHFTSQEDCVYHRLFVTLRPSPDKGIVSRVKKQINKPALGGVEKTSLSSRPLSAGNNKVNTSVTLSSSLPLQVENTASNVQGSLPSSLSVSAGNTTVNAPSTLSFKRTVSAGNDKVNTSGTLSSSLPLLVENTASNAQGTLPSSLSVSVGNTTVNAPSTLFFKRTASAGNDKVNTSSTLSSSLPLLVENTASNAQGTLPSSLSVSARNITVNAPSTLPFKRTASAGNDKVNTSGTLSSSLPLLVENTASNAQGTFPSSLSVSAGNTTVNAPSTLPFKRTVSAGNDKVNSFRTLSSSLPLLVENTASNAQGTLPSSLSVSAGNISVNPPNTSSSSLPLLVKNRPSNL